MSLPVNVKEKLTEAIALHQDGQVRQAEQIYQQILQINSQDAEALHLLGVVALQAKKYEVAVKLITQATKIDSKQSSFFNNLGIALIKQGKLEEAVQACQQAIKLQPDDAETHYNLGIALQKQERLEQALTAYQEAIKMQPDNAEIYNNLGVILWKQGKLEESIQSYQKAIGIQPDYAEPYNNLGNVLQEQGKLEESIQSYQKAIGIQPDYAEPHNNLGNALREQGKLEESIQSYQKAIGIQPDYAEPHNNLGQTLLLKGNLNQGWKEYEWRWQCKDFYLETRYFPQVWWDGSDLNGKLILVWAEQGVGDQIMFASMFDDLLRTKANIITDCDIRLIPLFERAFPKIQFCPRENPPVQQLFDIDIDYQIPIGSLGRWLRSRQNDFKIKNQSYLKACPEKTSKLKTKYKKLADDKLLIGISWKSSNQNFGKAKSTPLEYWTSILSKQDCFFINLQYGDVRQEIEEYTSNKSNISIYLDDEIDPLKNLDDFAAQVSTLDLVISTSNATVHMAGALGKKVWNLLRYMPSWRWMLNRQDTPWYPSMRLLRQNKIRNWLGVFEEVEQSLDQYIIMKNPDSKTITS